MILSKILIGMVVFFAVFLGVMNIQNEKARKYLALRDELKILDINMGMNGIDEKETMLQVINHVTMISNIPLAIDSSKIDVLEAALRIYPGRALINSISLESEKFEKLIPIAKKYGAMFILLPLSEAALQEV